MICGDEFQFTILLYTGIVFKLRKLECNDLRCYSLKVLSLKVHGMHFLVANVNLEIFPVFLSSLFCILNSYL